MFRLRTRHHTFMRITKSMWRYTLLIVGGHDEPVIEMNQAACYLLTCAKKLIIVFATTCGSLQCYSGAGAGPEITDLQMLCPRLRFQPAFGQ